MRVLFFMGVYLPRPGGVPRNTHNMVMALREMGVDIRVFAPHEAGDQGLELPYRVYRYHRPPVKRLFTRIHLLKLLAIKRSWPFELIHCHGIDPAAYCASFFKSIAKTAYIVTPRRTNIFKKERHFLHKRRNLRSRKGLVEADRVTALSSEIARIVTECGVRPDRIVRIPHGIDPAPFKTARPALMDRPYILALGRLVAFKGFDLLIDAFKMVAERFPEVDLVIAGSGPKEEELKRQVECLGLSGRVILPGRVEGEEKLSLYKGASMFVLPSRPGNEGFPNVILEAMAAGLPVVATRVSGAEDIVIPGRTGYIVPPGDKGGLADAMGRLLANPDLMTRKEILSALEPYHHERIMKRYLDLYEELIRKP